jgi:hypothetical protein
VEDGVSDGLARRYRRLLLCYPRSYRRTRGAEIVGTLLDAAPPDRTEPTRAEALDLLAGGVRYRLRVRGGAVLAAVAAALLGAVAVGATLAYAGWQSAADLPGNDRARALAATALPLTVGEPVPGLTVPVTAVPSPRREDFLFGADPLDDPPWLLALTGTDGYHEGGVRYGIDFRGPADRAAVEAVRDRMRAADWQVGRVDAHLWGAGTVGYRDGLRMRVEVAEWTADTSRLSVFLTRTPPAAVRPLTALGLLTGALAGWLIVAAAARRTRTRSPARRATIAALFGVGAFLTLPATGMSAAVTIGTFLMPSEPAPVWAGYTFIGARPLSVVGLALLLSALGVARVATRCRTSVPETGAPMG